MVASWDAETARVVASFDRIAQAYGEAFAGKLAVKPFDRRLFATLADRIPPGAPVLEVGAGPAQISEFLAARGVPVVVSAASLGQVRQARVRLPRLPVMAADLARLPVRAGALGGIIAYYCLMYGASEHLDRVFVEWYRALRSGGVIAIALHAGTGTIHATEWAGHTIDILLRQRDPANLVSRLRQAGFRVTDCQVRQPYPDEHPTRRCYLQAVKVTD